MQNISIYPGAILELKSILKNKCPKKIFLVTGKESYIKCGASEKLRWLNEDYNIVHFFDFESNPSSIEVEEGVKIFNKEKCNLIISVGGGSPIDMAKLINYFHCHDYETLEIDNLKNPDFKPIPHICLPTTAGSGSESTHFAVMYIGNEKFSIAHENLIPEIAIIDPELHYSQTPYQKAVSGADALAQAIESLWSIQSTDESRSYSEKALELMWNNLPTVVHHGDKLAHLYVAIGANFAGRAINIAKTTAPHALSYGITKYAGFPHGHAVAISLPIIINLNNKITENNCIDKRGITHVKNQLKRIANILNSEPLNLPKLISDYFSSINIETKIKKLAISDSILKDIVSRINFERMSNNPIYITKEELLKHIL